MKNLFHTYIRNDVRLIGPSGFKSLFRLLLVVAVFLTAVHVDSSISAQTATDRFAYRCKLTLAIDVEEKTYVGFSIFEVIWRRGFDAGGPAFGSHIRGQAAYVDLGKHGAIVAALKVLPDLPATKNRPLEANWICGRAFGNGSTYSEVPALPQLKGHRTLAADNMPLLLYFPNPTTSSAFEIVLPQNIGRLLNTKAVLRFANVEITSEPLSDDIKEKLPWLKPLIAKERTKLTVRLPGQHVLTTDLFLGETHE